MYTVANLKHKLKFTSIPLFFLIVFLVYSISWGTAIFSGGHLIQGDFIATYTAIQVINKGYNTQLYDFSIQRQVQHTFAHLSVPPEDLLPYITPPFFIIPFLPLGFLSYSQALLIMISLNVGLTVGVVSLLRKNFFKLKRISYWTIILACFSFFPCFINLIQGQNSAITLLILTQVYILIKKQRNILAGAILAVALYKPQLVFVFGLLFFIKQQWLIMFGFGMVTSFLMTFSYLFVGHQGFVDYINLVVIDSPLKDGLYGINYPYMHNWRALFRIFLGSNHSTVIDYLTITTTVLSLCVLLWAWRHHWNPHTQRFDLQFALAIIITLLISPHLNTHDLTLWILVGAIMLNYAMQNRKTKYLEIRQTVGLIICGTIITFITFPLNDILHVPLTTIFMVVLAIILSWQIHTIGLPKNDSKEQFITC